MTRGFRQALLYTGLVLSASFFVFWGPLALFGVPAFGPGGSLRGPVWAAILFVAGGFAPSAVGLSLAYRRDGARALREQSKSAFATWMGWDAFASILLAFSVLALGQVLLNRLLGSCFDVSLFARKLPALPLLFLLGPLAQEFGWRGVLYPGLRSMLSPVAAGLLTGLVWALWSLPLFLIPGTMQSAFALPFVAFALQWMLLSVLMGSFLERTNGAISSALLIHWLYAYVQQTLWAGRIPSARFEWYAVLVLAVVVCGALWEGHTARASE